MKKSKKKKVASKKGSKTKITSKPKTALSPLGDRVLLKPLAPETVTSFGIIIPDTAKEKPEQGTVIAVGPGKKTDDGKLVPISIKVGDRVLFSKYGFDEVKVGGVEYYLVSEANILAVLN